MGMIAFQRAVKGALAEGYQIEIEEITSECNLKAANGERIVADFRSRLPMISPAGKVMMMDMLGSFDIPNNKILLGGDMQIENKITLKMCDQSIYLEESKERIPIEKWSYSGISGINKLTTRAIALRKTTVKKDQVSGMKVLLLDGENMILKNN